MKIQLIYSNFQKLLSTFLFATTQAQAVSYEDCADVALPDGAEDHD